MKLTIIPSDKAVYVNRVCAFDIDANAPANVHALQWDGNSGRIEYNDGVENEAITTLPDWATSCIDAWTVATTPPPVISLTPEQIATAAREAAKAARTASVEAIKVTTQAGNTYDGDEVSQGRMARAVLALSTGLAPSVTWVLADNSVIDATAAELTEALVLAGQAQANLWVID